VFSSMMINSRYLDIFSLKPRNVSLLPRHCSVEIERNGVWMEGVPQLMCGRCGGVCVCVF